MLIFGTGCDKYAAFRLMLPRPREGAVVHLSKTIRLTDERQQVLPYLGVAYMSKRIWLTGSYGLTLQIAFAG